MKKFTARNLQWAGAILLIVFGTNGFAAVGGRALLLDAPSRVKPGNLFLCTIAGEEKKYDKIVEGKVVDAHFSPDGKQVVYGVDGVIKILNLATKASHDIGTYSVELTYFNWCQDNKIYFSDGPELREIFSIDIATKERKSVSKGTDGRTTISLDGKKAAWVMPPVCAVLGGKTYRYMGGCGGSVSPSGKYLTSNLTTSHQLMGIFSWDDNGPTEKPITTVSALPGHSINGFSFGRTDDWVCYTVEAPEKITPIAYICYWKTNDHIELGKYCIKDFFDETDVVPTSANLDSITVCSEGPVNTPLTHEMVNVGMTHSLKVVGHYSDKGVQYTPQLHDGVTWKVDNTKLALTSSSYKGLAESGPVPVTAEYKGKTFSFDIAVLPALTGDGFKAEYFKDTTYTTVAVSRVDPYIDFRWEGFSSPDPAIDRKTPWSVRWTGTLNIQVDGEYTFYFLQGEGNDRFIKSDNGEKNSAYSVWVDDKLTISLTGNASNYPWARPKASPHLMLKKGPHTIKVMTVMSSAQPVVAQLFWSGPGIKQTLLGGRYIQSK